MGRYLPSTASTTLVCSRVSEADTLETSERKRAKKPQVKNFYRSYFYQQKDLPGAIWIYTHDQIGDNSQFQNRKSTSFPYIEPRPVSFGSEHTRHSTSQAPLRSRQATRGFQIAGPKRAFGYVLPAPVDGAGRALQQPGRPPHRHPPGQAFADPRVQLLIPRPALIDPRRLRLGDTLGRPSPARLIVFLGECRHEFQEHLG